MKRRIIASLLMGIVFISSSVTVYGQNITGTRTLPTSTLSSSTISALPFKTVDGQEVLIPKKVSKLTKENSKVKSFSTDDFVSAKKVADKSAAALTTTYGCTSVQYALISNGSIVLSGNAGVYSKEENKLLTADNMYGIGSVSKMFTTTAVMKLVDEGKVDLDTPVTHYINDFTMADKRYKKITVRMLLNHSSGLMGSTFNNAILLGDNDLYAHDTLLKQLRTQHLKANPGEYSVYCNDGFTLAEILVERVTGTSFTDYIAKNITDPLKMNNTKTPASEFDRERLAKTYTYGISKALPTDNFNTIGAGGIYSSAENLCTLATTFTKNSNGILSKKSVKAMENKEYLRGIWPKDTDNSLNYGLGWDSVKLYPFNRYNIKALSKAGDSRFYHSGLVVLPKHNMAMAVVSSGGLSTYDELMAEKVLLTALKEKGVINKIKADKKFTAPKKVKVPSAMKKYEGLYATYLSGFFKVKIHKSGTLTLSYPGMSNKNNQTYVYTKKGTFVYKDGSAGLKFVKEKNGRIYIEEIMYASLPSIGQMADDEYFAQKEKENKLTKSVAKAWAKRKGKKYFVLNEKYSSTAYALFYPYLQVSFPKGLNGYLGTDKIVNKNLATAIFDGPGSMSRDLYDVEFYKKDNVEYLQKNGTGYNGSLYIEQDAIKNLSAEDKFTCTIGKDGYAQWYKIGSDAADKEITVNVPDKANFVVYDSDGMLLNNYRLSGDNKVTLPRNGMIVFLGSADANFTVQHN